MRLSRVARDRREVTMDEESFDDFYVTSFPRIVGQVYAMIGDRDEAAECVQEAFIKAWARRHQLDDHQHPEAWIRTVAHRLAVSRWRRAVRGRQLTRRAHVGPAFAAPPNEDQVAVVAALRQLPEGQRRAIVLHHIADLPIREVARELGVAEGTVKARLSRGRTALAALLDDSQLRGGETHV